ncbi:MAG TPA: hypothetical protein VMM38_13785 [Aridibacter sp.]|nr:hypothetical protein [Aridibacter sp.]
MILKFALFSAVVILLGAASYVFVANNLVEHKGEVVITDADIDAPGSKAASEAFADDAVGEVESFEVQEASEVGSTSVLGDLSTISTTVDGMGNRTETRVFRSHSRLRMVLLQTTGDGSKKAYVYGHLGGVKTLYGSDADSVLSMSADQLANKVEIFETKLDKYRQRPKIARSSSGSLEPLDSSEIEINSPDAGSRVQISESSGSSADEDAAGS